MNGQILSCQMRATDGVGDCEPSGNEWRTCAAFYDHGYTVTTRSSTRTLGERESDSWALAQVTDFLR